jgi:hypothetical protein
MTASEKLLLFALEAARPEQVDALLALALAKGVPLAELVDEALSTWLAKELDEGDA